MDQILPSGGLVTLIHFCYLEGEKERIACMPGMTEFHQTMHHPNYQRTNEPRAVSCPACKKSPVYVNLTSQPQSQPLPKSRITDEEK